jgi:hypothetical protein
MDLEEIVMKVCTEVMWVRVGPNGSAYEHCHSLLGLKETGTF